MKICLAFILETTCMCKVYTYLSKEKKKKNQRPGKTKKKSKLKKIIKATELSKTSHQVL